MISISGFNSKLKEHKTTFVLTSFLLGSSLGLVGCGKEKNSFTTPSYILYEKTLPPRVSNIVNSKDEYVKNKLSEEEINYANLPLAEGIITKAEDEVLAHALAINPTLSNQDLSDKADSVISQSIQIIGEQTSDDFWIGKQKIDSNIFTDSLNYTYSIQIGDSYNLPLSAGYMSNASMDAYKASLPKRAAKIVDANNEIIKKLFGQSSYQTFNINFIEYSLSEYLTHMLAKDSNITDDELNNLANKFIDRVNKTYLERINQFGDSACLTEEFQKDLTLLQTLK